MFLSRTLRIAPLALALGACLASPIVANTAFAQTAERTSRADLAAGLLIGTPAPGWTVAPAQVIASADLSWMAVNSAMALESFAPQTAGQTGLINLPAGPSSTALSPGMMGLLGANIALNVADLVTTSQGLQQGGTEANPVMKAPWARYGLKTAMMVGSTYFATKLWHENKKSQAVLLTAITTVVAGAAVAYNRHQLSMIH